jgi:hypothetical protein
MAKQPTKNSEKKDRRLQKVRDLPVKGVGASKGASVKGGVGRVEVRDSHDRYAN